MADRSPPLTPTGEYDTVEIDYSSTILDLSSFQLHDLDSVELPPGLTEVDLTANRLSKLDPRIGTLSSLKKLSFRQNLLGDDAVESLSSWHALSDLEVFEFLHFFFTFDSSLCVSNCRIVIQWYWLWWRIVSIGVY